jgi:hypothetical protein
VSLLARWRAYRGRQARLNAPPRLVATMVRRVRWTDLNNLVEEITFLLKEDGRGRRSYEVHQYGTCLTFKKHRDYAGPVKVWMAGGPLPPHATPVRSPGVARLTVIK